MKDEMKEIIDRIAPPPGGGLDDDDDDDGDADEAPARARKAKRRRLPPEDGAAEGDVTDAALAEAEEEIERHRETEVDDELGDFNEKEYAARIAGWEFRADEAYVKIAGEYRECDIYFRRPLRAPAGTKWERIGHERSANALDLRRMMYCAQQRDARAEEAQRRYSLIEGLFGAGSVPLIESLVAARGSDAAPLTPRQEAFCRHYLTEPSGTRAAILAGYAESGAKVQAHRLLTNANVARKISALRRAHALTYALDRDTMLDKLEAFFEDAMQGQSYSAALRALLAQAELAGLLNRRHKATERAETRARASLETAAAPEKSPNDDA